MAHQSRLLAAVPEDLAGFQAPSGNLQQPPVTPVPGASDTLSWFPWARGTHMVHRPMGRQKTHTHK